MISANFVVDTLRNHDLNRQAVSAQTVMDAVCISLGALINTTGARICSGLPAVDADASQLEQLLQNVVANAIKYQRPGIAPEIEIRADRHKDEWRFSVKDNGEGISAEHQGLVSSH